MIKITVSFLLIVFLISPKLLAQVSFNVMSYNIKESASNQPGNQWDERDTKVISMLNFYAPDIIGFQEVTQEQLDYLNLQLKDYEFYGIGREDGLHAGEYCPLYYKKGLFKLKDKGTFWLSEAPGVPGTRGWDAHIPRIVSWVKLQSLKSKQEFVVFNTHFDHEGISAQEESAWLLMEKINEISEFLPAIVTGDFNVRSDAEPYRILTTDSIILDSRSISVKAPHGPNATFNGFDVASPYKKRIDYIFVKPPFKVMRYATLSDGYETGFPSDHFPVLIEAVLHRNN